MRSWSHCCLFKFLSRIHSSKKQSRPAVTQTSIRSGTERSRHGLNFYSARSRDCPRRSQLAREVERSTNFIDDPRVNEYVNRIGQNLVRNSDARLSFTFKVIDSDEVDAFATLPGGFLYVNRGLILRAGGEAELAGILNSHEIAHVCARHGTRNSTRNEIAQVAGMSLIFLGPGGWADYAIYNGFKVGLPLTFLKFSRSGESEADYLGLQYMFSAGYDPEAFITFFERVDSETSPGKFATMFSSHPPTRNRIKAIQKEIATILPDRDRYIVTTSEFDVIKSRPLSGTREPIGTARSRRFAREPNQTHTMRQRLTVRRPYLLAYHFRLL